MKRQVLILTALFLLIRTFATAQADDSNHQQKSFIHLLNDATSNAQYQQMPPTGAKATRDTVLLIGPWGSGAPFNGQFQNQQGEPSWNGWTHDDPTSVSEMHWQISDYNAEGLGATQAPGNLAAWCGDLSYPPCSAEDPAGGYGNNWREELRWTGTVADPGEAVAVHFSCYVNIDTEPGYDYVSFKYLTPAGSVLLAVHDDVLTNEFLEFDFIVNPEDLFGPDDDQVVLQVTFESDGGWSDQDCLHPTSGALQIDDISVTLSQEDWSLDSETDFQDGYGDWEPTFPMMVGDFTQLWTGLMDLDPCSTNFSPQVAWVDDGLVVPGVGPSYCLDWCYGPGGYIVNGNGGAGTLDMNLDNRVISPVLEWPAEGYEGFIMEFDVYRHQPAEQDFTGIWYDYAVRSANIVDEFGNPTGNTIEETPWQVGNSFWYGGPGYRRYRLTIYTGVPGEDVFQVAFRVNQDRFGGYFYGQNGTPGPYLDNVRLKVFQSYGPILYADGGQFAQDNFPSTGEIDLINLGNNSVRFDTAITFLDQDSGLPVTYDGLVFNAVPSRQGAELQGNPRVHFRIKQNPLFDPYRTNPEFGTADFGTVEADSFLNNAGDWIAGKWIFDLPDSNFLFPGDILHYYLEATDGGGPDNLEIQTVISPWDTTGFSDFSGVRSYNANYTMRALPSIHESPNNPGELVTPSLLFWNDGENSLWNAWIAALNNLGYVEGVGYDVFLSKGNDSGLGGRATPYTLTGYDAILYGCGNQTIFGLTDGTDPFASNDLEVLDAWLRQGNRNLWLTGNKILTHLMSNGGPTSVQFIEDWLKVSLIGEDLRLLVGNQTTPMVQAIPDNGVFLEDQKWIAYGGCPNIYMFDAVTADESGGAIQLAEFLSPGGTGAYTYSAATLYEDPIFGSRVVSMPYDLAYVHTPLGGDKAPAPLAARTQVMERVLALFGIEGDPLDVSPVPDATAFGVRSYPNPFNPVVKLEYTLPRPGHLSLKVFDLKGHLVRTLVDEHRETSGHVMWDGTDEQGAQMASGVYFYEARTAGQVQVDKMVLVK